MHHHHDPVNPTHPNYPSDHAYYDTVVEFGQKPHHSHTCRFKDCEAPTVIEGYCPFHYQLVCAHESRYYLKNMTYFLQDIHRVLRRFEEEHFPIPHPPHDVKCHACQDFQNGTCRGAVKCPR